MGKFVPRQRKHKVLQRNQGRSSSANPNIPPTATSDSHNDSNALELLPIPKAEREARRQKLREELRSQLPKVSSKKQKRLDKYIENKLKKEETQEILKKLAENKIDTSLFRSSKELGRAGESKREVLARAAKEYRAGIDVKKNESILVEVRERPISSTEQKNKKDKEQAVLLQESNHEEPKTQAQATSEMPEARFGSGLKRPLDVDQEGKPVIKRRKRTKKDTLIAPMFRDPMAEESGDDEWQGFSSEAEQQPISDNDASMSDDASSSDGEDLQESETDTSSSDTDDTGEDDKHAKKARTSAFKEWATQQKNQVIGFQPSNMIMDELKSTTKALAANFTPRAPENDPLPPELETTTHDNRKAFSVVVDRPIEIQEARLALPVVAEEQKIMEAIHNNDVVVVWGATGSGKTTQVPQFLYEAGYGNKAGPTPGMIGITQPRRVAAVSMSKRVAQELGADGEKVAYQIRFDSSVSDKTAVKFMTDGVLLREIAQDFALRKYSAIVIDEAHERSINTDILIGMMSRIVDLRSKMARGDPQDPTFQPDADVKPLKLIIMSATLRISDFTQNSRLFRHVSPPLLQAEGRQYPVSVHFARRTQRDYVDEAFQKICRGHKKLPRGGMLVFLTGQNEITALAKRLREAFSTTEEKTMKLGPVRVNPADVSIETEDIEIGEALDRYQDEDGSDNDSEADRFEDEDEDEDKEFDIGEEAENTPLKVHVLPLYSQLPTNQQLKVFDPPPEGSRMIVLATNVAETSLTIPGIRYVFDCGRAKEKKYDKTTGVQSFEIGWISKASASQRTGRAGRTGPGHCYRLYSSAVFERDFEEYAEPEILRTPIEGVVLQLKSMNLVHVVNFPFPTPPGRESLVKAERLLSYLGAVSSPADGKTFEITKMGRELSLYPLNPRFSKMLVMGQSHNLTAYSIALVAALAIPEVFIPENQLGLGLSNATNNTNDEPQDAVEEEMRVRRQKAYNKAHASLSRWDSQCDALKLLTALCAYGHSPSPTDFCEENFLRARALHEASQLREQLTSIVRNHRPSAIGQYNARLSPPTTKELGALKQIIAAGFIDQVAIRADLAPNPPDLPRKPKRAIDVPYLTLFSSSSHQKANDDTDRFVYIHPSSLLSRTAPAKLPAYIIYSRIQRSSSLSSVPKIRIYPLTPISSVHLAGLAKGTPLLQYSKPVGKITALERGKNGSERRDCIVEISLIGEKGHMGWSLGRRRVVQNREPGRGWIVEKELEN